MKLIAFEAGDASSFKFQSAIAHDLVRLAAEQEGLEGWLARHGGSTRAPSQATRIFADALFGDSIEASIFNAALSFEIGRITRAA